ncbi:MAG: hypothetical protein COT81_01695 [Candidatus Buchananbacteria bacterium CG10_big_fil_rev_8_21_14_0_10_42_9]|uniref:Bacterial type II secretion system protein E domain-containing protein n=1 Tax=Candidatus Buchananbacteria bacterium CG10_big_fil_rev_8_21_14_0_10_42_9 TaxID=1974526 RepID=A0A2H0W227_9BACT|nr:MAG: hypothetical protein COT81_01695 [Candidatus Buchananbacteria bacterium CG10_big_fil_rev_8_21_14_0_10_42_9]
MKISNDRLKILIEKLDLIDAKDLKQAYQESESENSSLSEVLVESDLIKDEQLGQVIAEDLGVEFVDLSRVDIDESVMQEIPELVAKEQQVIAYAKTPEAIKIATAEPANLEMIKLVEKKTGFPVSVHYATPKSIRSAIVRYHKGIEKEFKDIILENVNEAKGGAEAEDLPIIKIVDSILNYAHDSKASDVHIEPTEKYSAVRFRIDGILHDILKFPARIHELVLTRIKVMAKLRLDEHFSAQDGKLRFKTDEGKVDVRVSILPIVEGEKIVMRLLSSKSREFSLQSLGMTSQDLKKVNAEYKKPYGMIMTTGPTGSGKTTTLYAILKKLNRREVNISTIEDPVEYDIDGVNQIQANPKTNLTFAHGLRSILRQDPDIIMVGEIRDEETAGIAINAAITGHLLLTSLHTNDAPTAIPRLLDMNIEPFLLASTLNIIIAQRLVRKICRQCVTSLSVDRNELKKILPEQYIIKYFGGGKNARLYKGKGCNICNSTGYQGRIGIFEVLAMSEAIRSSIMKRSNVDEIRTIAQKEGMRTMIEDGIEKAKAGLTSLEEVIRVVRN